MRVANDRYMAYVPIELESFVTHADVRPRCVEAPAVRATHVIVDVTLVDIRALNVICLLKTVFAGATENKHGIFFRKILSHLH